MRQNKQPALRRCPQLKPSTARSHPGLPDTGDPLWGAREVYEALCASTDQRIGGFEFACGTVAARQISGDFVIAFERHGEWYITLGDLMGKGLSAAMWLTHVLDLVKRSCETGLCLQGIMSMLNRDMHRSRVGVPLVSLFLAKLEPVAGRLTYCCGGCPPGFLLSDSGRLSMLERGGPILGAFEESTYVSATIDFALHDTLLVVSDGILEVHRDTTFELRPDLVARHLQFTAGDSAGSIVRSLLTRVQNSSPVLADDLSLLALKRVA
jgi:sigma-B regulation protein RsbU (phosphoserine phosphatase)